MRLCHLVASMYIEEAMPLKRSIPSAFSLIKAEFGIPGNRAQVLERARALAQDGEIYVGN